MPVSSVAADQLNVTVAHSRSLAVRPVGVVGGWVSAVAAGAGDSPADVTPTSTVQAASMARRRRRDDMGSPSTTVLSVRVTGHAEMHAVEPGVARGPGGDEQ